MKGLAVTSAARSPPPLPEVPTTAEAGYPKMRVDNYFRRVRPRWFARKDVTALADWGRKEIRIAETEMPGLMAIRDEYGKASRSRARASPARCT